MINIEVKVVIPINCKLGEGIHWDSERNALWFVDILNNCLYNFNLDTFELKQRYFDESVGWVFPLKNSDKVIIGLKSGIAELRFFDFNDSIVRINNEFPNQDNLRLNDAKVDKYGRIWYGSISIIDESLPVGTLVRLSIKNNKLDIIDTNYTVTNGPAFNLENTIMLHNDSGNRITYKFDLDKITGEVINKSIWKKYKTDEGYPDGINFDSDENIWIAHWGVGKVCKYNIDGMLLQEIQFPTPNVTNICFGGNDLNRMFVTSAFRSFDNADNFNVEYDGVVYEVLGTNSKGINSHYPET